MEMTDEEFWQKCYIAVLGNPLQAMTANEVRCIANNAVKMHHEEFRNKAPEGTPPDVRSIRSHCAKCNAVNEESFDLVEIPEGSTIDKECSNCGTEYSYEVRIESS